MITVSIINAYPKSRQSQTTHAQPILPYNKSAPYTSLILLRELDPRKRDYKYPPLAHPRRTHENFGSIKLQ